MKLWSGRFKKDVSKILNNFNSSIDIDSRMFREDINGSIAHVDMLTEIGIIDADENTLIINGLNSILTKIEKGEIEFSRDNEDIHMNIESLLINEIGDVAKKIHTGRSRNDQVALDIRMYLKKEVLMIKFLILEFQKVIYSKALKHTDTIMPGYTHLQRAQPISFAHHLLAYSEMFKRDLERFTDCYKRIDSMPLGAGALATTSYNIKREFVQDKLGFNRLCLNSIDAVSDRDFIVELASDISISMMHLSRFSEEIIFWSSLEFNFIELDDAFATGSSIMPQKKNPDAPELVRGKCGRVYGNLIASLTMLKSLPLAYNKDMQEDKEMIFDSIDTYKSCMQIFTEMIKTITVKEDKMLEACSDGFINATDLADYLVKKGEHFRDAHRICGNIVSYCIDKNIKLDDLSIAEFKNFANSIDIDIYEHIDLKTCLNSRAVIGGPSKNQVLNQLDNLEQYILKEENLLNE
ncbi:MAG: argininosuccinate lyase [Sarcina sp.]